MRFIDGYVKSPLAGIVPWILMSVVSAAWGLEAAAAAALGLALLTMWVGSRRGGHVHQLEVFGLAYFGVLLVLGLAAPEGTVRWLQLWAGQLSSIALAVFAIFTLLIRRPFTLAYAKETTPREFWDSPLFRRINYVISAVWAGAFLFSAVVGAYGIVVLRDNDDFWTGWILQIAGTIFAVSFTKFYPDYASAKFAQSVGEPTDPPPSLARLLDWLPSFIVVTGIIGWVTNSFPHAVGIALIAVGTVGSMAMRRFFPDKGTESSPAAESSGP
jgi:MFS family permease